MKLRKPVMPALALSFCVGGALLSSAAPPVFAAPAKKSSATKTKPTKSNSTKPTSGARDTALIEAALGVTLTDAQKTAIAAAATTRDAAALAALTSYKTAVAAVFGLSAADLDLKLKSLAKGKTDLSSSLTAVLGRELTTAEITALADATALFKVSLTAATDAYSASVAATLGVTTDELALKVQAYLDAHPTKSGADCKPGTSGTTSGSTSGAATTGTGAYT